MIPTGCTCSNKFTIPYTPREVEAIRVTYSQNRECILEKELRDCTFEDGCVCVNLSQEDTLKFKERLVVKIQLKVKLIDGTVTKSNVLEEWADEVLNKEVI